MLKPLNDRVVSQILAVLCCFMSCCRTISGGVLDRSGDEKANLLILVVNVTIISASCKRNQKTKADYLSIGAAYFVTVQRVLRLYPETINEYEY